MFHPFYFLENRYEEHWKNKDESSNFQQRHYEDIIINEQMVSLENELRKVVDEMMGAELQMLQVCISKKMSSIK